MRKDVFLVIAIVILSVSINACTKRQNELTPPKQSADLEVEPIFMSDIAENSEQKDQGIYLPPGGPYRPTAQEIQTALKNAGYYLGNIDGKIGPLTTEAIKDFQKANNLEIDAKVGPQTWKILRRYLSPPSD